MTTTTQALVYINEPVLEVVDDPLTNFLPNAKELIGGETEVETPDLPEPVTYEPSPKEGPVDLYLNNDDNLRRDTYFVELIGGLGNDKLNGDGQTVEMDGGSGDDTLIGNGNFVEMDGGSGDDTLIGNGKFGFIQGGLGDDTLFTNGKFVEMDGGSGNDFIIDGRGDDRIKGRTGIDMITGGEGEDVFALTKGDGYDKIIDFNKGEDKIIMYWEIIDDDLLITNVGRDAHIYIGDDLLAVVMNAAGMLERQDDYTNTLLI